MKVKDKNGAMFYLKRMKAYDKEIAALYGKRANLDTLVLSLEAASFDKGLVAAMSTAHQATKTMVTDADVERVQDLVGDLQESRRMAEEIGNALAEVRFNSINISIHININTHIHIHIIIIAILSYYSYMVFLYCS